MKHILFPKHPMQICSEGVPLGENSETQVWLDFSLAYKYINEQSYDKLLEKSAEVGRLLNHMINNPEKYINKK